MNTPCRLKILLLAALTLLSLMGCTVRIHSGSNQWDFALGGTPTAQPTYTANPTNKPFPSFTPFSTHTPLPTLTAPPTYTLQPTYTHGPTTTYVPVNTAKPTNKTPSATTSTSLVVPTARAGEVSQFAKGATASSQYSAGGWSAAQAGGVPNTTKCGDSSTAWASQNANTKDWLLLTYDQPVIPTRIIIYQTYHPGAVALVEVVDDSGKSTAVYQATPAVSAACPAKLEIAVKNIDFPVRVVRVTIDQSKHNGWAEIDAVQLFGKLK